MGDNEVLRCKAERKASEEWDGAAILSLKGSPENLRRGSRRVVKPASLPRVDIQLFAGVLHGKDAEDVKKDAEQHLEEDQELDKGGVSEQQQQQQDEGEVPEQGMESGAVQRDINLRSSSSMAPHPRGALRAGEALQLLQGGDGQPLEGVEQGQRRELPEGAEESTRKAQRLDEDAAVPEPESKKSKTL